MALDNKEQARLKWEAEQREAQAKKEAAKYLEKHREHLESQAAELCGGEPEKEKLIVEEAARLYGQKAVEGRFSIDERTLINDAWKNVNAAEATHVEAEVLAARQAEALKRQEQEKQAEKEKSLNSAKELGQKGDVAAAAWVAQAETANRQHHQGGRYDALRTDPPDNGPTPPKGGPVNGKPPHNPTNSPPNGPPPGGPKSGPLSANEVLGRFGDSDVEARYNEDQQRREQDTKSAYVSADSATKSAARGNSVSSAAEAKEPSLMDFYVTAQDRKNAEEERAARANDPSKGQMRGGRGR
jgi:hypothetical protein